MASKQQRGDVYDSQYSKVYDKKRFVSVAALDRYYSLLADKALIPERGIKPHETQDIGVAYMIKEKGYENFTQQLEAAVVVIVKEFYVNVWMLKAMWCKSEASLCRSIKQVSMHIIT